MGKERKMGEKKLNKKGRIETMEGKIGKGQNKNKFYFENGGRKGEKRKNKEEKIKNQFTNVKRLLEWYGRLI